MTPEYRFTIVMSFLLVSCWFYIVLSTYLFGEGLNLVRYSEGVLWVGSSTFAGFLLVWLVSRLMVWQKTRNTGFEAGASDEFGTAFEMTGPDGNNAPYKVSLSKFLPQLVAPPAWEGLSPLEAELFGFLNAYRSWPVDLKDPGTSLYEKAFARWQVMRHLPGTGPWHRVMALSKDLAFVQAYKEVRTVHPLLQFWLRDSVRYVRRCAPHGGVTAFVLSTLPAFRALGTTSEGAGVQRALLTALRYHENPALLPVNAGPLARELVDYLWRADSQLKYLDVGEVDLMTPELLASLRDVLSAQWLTSLDGLEMAAEPDAAMVSLKQSDGTLWLKQPLLLDRLSTLLSPELRQVLQLWDSHGGIQHPAWVHLAPMLLDMGLIAGSHEGVSAVNGCFLLRAGEVSVGPMLKLQVDPAKHLPLLKQWQPVEGYKGPVDVMLDLDQLTAMATAKVTDINSRMAEIGL